MAGVRCSPQQKTPPSDSIFKIKSALAALVLISKIHAAGGLMGNDHILSLRTGNALVQRRAPALGQHICVPG